MLHELKTWPTFFDAVKDGRKTFEIRKNDRHFKVGDELLLKEFVPKNYYEDNENEHYTGKILHRKISYVLKSENELFGIKKDYVILGLQQI